MISKLTLVLPAAALLAACASAPVAPPAPTPTFSKPGAERLARLAPWDRAALDVDGELVRLAAAPQDAFAAPAARGRGAGAAPSGPFVVALREDAGGAVVYTHVGPLAAYRGGAAARIPALVEALQAARDASPFHRPVAARVGTEEVTAVLDVVPEGAGASPGVRRLLSLRWDSSKGVAPPAGGRSNRTALEVAMEAKMRAAAATKAGARATGPSTVLVLELVEGDAPGGGKALRPRTDRPLRLLGTVAAVGDIRLEPDGRLAAISFPPWRPAPEFFLAGRTSRDLWGSWDRGTEAAVNDWVVEWKTRQLPGWLQRAAALELEDAIVTTEKGILALDLAVRTVKDRVDAAARKDESSFQDAGEVEQLLEQRKMLLGVVLQATKGMAQQRVR